MKETKTYFSDELKTVVWEINGFVSTEKFKEFALETLNLRNKHSVNRQLNNVENMKVLTKEIMVWIDEVWFPKAKAEGLKHLAFVVPSDTFGKATMETVNADAQEKFGMNIEYFTDEESAQKWIISQQ